MNESWLALEASYSHDLPTNECGACKEKVECWNSVTKDMGKPKVFWSNPHYYVISLAN